jgi:predicted metal-dependent hydrolase
VVYAPESTRRDDLESWTRKKLVWVYQKLSIKHDLAAKTREPEYVPGENFQYLGRSYRLMLVDGQRAPLAFDGRHFTLRKDARPAAGEHFRKWFIERGTEWIAQRTHFLVRRAGVKPSRVEVRDLGFRWGSCGSNGTLLLNWRLLQLPVRLADYVICHELVHLRERHHGRTFWALLESIQPDWRERKQQLAKRAQTLFWV